MDLVHLDSLSIHRCSYRLKAQRPGLSVHAAATQCFSVSIMTRRDETRRVLCLTLLCADISADERRPLPCEVSRHLLLSDRSCALGSFRKRSAAQCIKANSYSTHLRVQDMTREKGDMDARRKPGWRITLCTYKYTLSLNEMTLRLINRPCDTDL